MNDVNDSRPGTLDGACEESRASRSTRNGGLDLQGARLDVLSYPPGLSTPAGSLFAEGALANFPAPESCPYSAGSRDESRPRCRPSICRRLLSLRGPCFACFTMAVGLGAPKCIHLRRKKQNAMVTSALPRLASQLRSPFDACHFPRHWSRVDAMIIAISGSRLISWGLVFCPSCCPLPFDYGEAFAERKRLSGASFAQCVRSYQKQSQRANSAKPTFHVCEPVTALGIWWIGFPLFPPFKPHSPI